MDTTVTVAMTASETGIAGLTLPTTTCSRTNTDNHTIGWDHEVPTSDEKLIKPGDSAGTKGEDITAIGTLIVKNNESAGGNSVRLSFDTGGSFDAYAFEEVAAGQIYVGRPKFPTGKDTIYIEADTAVVNATIRVVEL